MSTEHAVWAMIKDETKSEKVRAVLSRTLLAAYWFQTTELESAIDHEGDKVSICIADCGCVSSTIVGIAVVVPVLTASVWITERIVEP
jgi:hypothetical protein